MRIAFVSYEYPPDSGLGGIATYVAQAARLMTLRGHWVEVFASSHYRNASVNIDGIVVHWIKENSRDDFPIIAGHKIAERHAVQPFDVLESPEYYADGRKAIELLPSLPLVIRLHTPSRFIVEMSWPHGKWYPYTRFKTLIPALFKLLLNKSGYLPTINPKQQWQLIDTFEKKITQKADRVVALCNDLKTFAISKWHCNPDQISFCPNVYLPRPELLSITPRKAGKTIGYFGRLERRKGIDLFVKAIPGILKNHPDAIFRFVGKIQDYSTGVPFDEWIKKTLLNYAESIEFIGHVDLVDMPIQYGLVDICVFPSRWENFPYVCLEAMSAGKAVIGSKHGGMSEMMPTESVGLLVDPFDVVQLKNAVCRLLSNSEERIQMGINARARVLLEYNADVIGKKMEAIFNEAIDHKKTNFIS